MIFKSALMDEKTWEIFMDEVLPLYKSCVKSNYKEDENMYSVQITGVSAYEKEQIKIMCAIAHVH